MALHHPLESLLMPSGLSPVLTWLLCSSSFLSGPHTLPLLGDWPLAVPRCGKSTSSVPSSSDSFPNLSTGKTSPNYSTCQHLLCFGARIQCIINSPFVSWSTCSTMTELRLSSSRVNPLHTGGSWCLEALLSHCLCACVPRPLCCEILKESSRT